MEPNLLDRPTSKGRIPSSSGSVLLDRIELVDVKRWKRYASLRNRVDLSECRVFFVIGKVLLSVYSV